MHTQAYDRITPHDLDEATIAIIFALRDSLTDDGPSRLDFWGGRVTTAIETAAAGAADAGEAITIAARKLQIPALTKDASQNAVTAADVINEDFHRWARHVEKNIVYITALARVLNTELQATKTKKGN